MFDKFGFYKIGEGDKKIYQLDLGASSNIEIENNEYVIFSKKRFKREKISNLKKGIGLLTERQKLNFKFDKDFFVSGLCYYQRNLKQAIIKDGELDELELYEKLYKDFGLELKYREYLEIHGDYETIENIKQKFLTVNIDQAISFLLALAVIYGDWNIVEEGENIYLGSILIKFPFDKSLIDFQNIIFSLEDILIENKIYNKLIFTKKQNFIWNIQDVDLLQIMGEVILLDGLKDFFQLSKKLEPLFNYKFELLKKQLNNDLRINLENFKITEVEGIN